MSVRSQTRLKRNTLLISTSVLALCVLVAPIQLDRDTLMPAVKIAAAGEGGNRNDSARLQALTRLGLDDTVGYVRPALSTLSQVASASGGGSGGGSGGSGGGSGAARAGGPAGAPAELAVGAAEAPVAERRVTST